MNLAHLRALVAVVDAGSFTEAARGLGLTQASVSRSVAALESSLGARLVQRTTRHVALTPVGARVVERARLILDEVEGLRQLVESARPEVRVGYAWAALGKHTRRVQKAWAHAFTVPLVFTHVQSPTAGLAEGMAEVAVVRRELADRRFATALVGAERRVAAVATENPLARRRAVSLADVARYTVAIDSRTGTTTLALWGANPPARRREARAVDEYLTLIAANQAVGITSEATAAQHPRPGIAYRAVRDAPPIDVWLAWWRDDPPPHLDELLALVTAAYAR